MTASVTGAAVAARRRRAIAIVVAVILAMMIGHAGRPRRAIARRKHHAARFLAHFHRPIGLGSIVMTGNFERIKARSVILALGGKGRVVLGIGRPSRCLRGQN